MLNLTVFQQVHNYLSTHTLDTMASADQIEVIEAFVSSKSQAELDVIIEAYEFRDCDEDVFTFCETHQIPICHALHDDDEAQDIFNELLNILYHVK